METFAFSRKTRQNKPKPSNKTEKKNKPTKNHKQTKTPPKYPQPNRKKKQQTKPNPYHKKAYFIKRTEFLQQRVFTSVENGAWWYKKLGFFEVGLRFSILSHSLSPHCPSPAAFSPSFPLAPQPGGSDKEKPPDNSKRRREREFREKGKLP